MESNVRLRLKDVSVVPVCTVANVKISDRVSTVLVLWTTQASVVSMNLTHVRLDAVKTVPLVLMTVRDIHAFAHLDSKERIVMRT